MKKAKISQQRDDAVDRIRELEATIDRLRSERGTDLVELTVSDATIDAARARIASLERTCDNLTQRIAMTERERDIRQADREPALRDELESVRARLEESIALAAAAADREIYEARAERDRLSTELQEARDVLVAFATDRERDEARLADLETRLSVCEIDPEEIRALEARVASLLHARERLFAGGVRSAEMLAGFERLAAERTEQMERMAAAQATELERVERERAQLADDFSNRRAELEDAVKRLESGAAKLEYDLDGAKLRLASTKADYDRLKVRAKHDEEQLERANDALAQTSEIVRALALTHRQATESIASLELVRVRLEYDVATRVGTSESNAARAALAANRLREDRVLLLETIALRERRIAMLETTIREIASDMIRAAEAERERYAAMHHALLASKIVKIRDIVRRILSRPLEVRARLLRGVGRPAKRRPRSGDKRPRHLRSA